MDLKLEEFRQCAADCRQLAVAAPLGVRQAALAGDDRALDEDGSCGRVGDEHGWRRSLPSRQRHPPVLRLHGKFFASLNKARPAKSSVCAC